MIARPSRGDVESDRRPRKAFAPLTVRAATDLIANDPTCPTYVRRPAYLEAMLASVVGEGGDIHRAILGECWVTEVRTEHALLALENVQTAARVRAEQRRTAGDASARRDGSSVGVRALAELRFVFRYALHLGHLTQELHIPAPPKPRRPGPVRCSPRLTTDHVQQMYLAIETGSRDPQLDTLIAQFIEVTAARQGDVYRLRRSSIDAALGTVLLSGWIAQPQPVPAWLIDRLISFADARGATGPDDLVFRGGRRTTSTALPRGRVDLIFARVMAALPWAAEGRLTAGALRAHSVARVADLAGEHVARRFARRRPRMDQFGQPALPQEVRSIVDALWPHDPLPPDRAEEPGGLAHAA